LKRKIKILYVTAEITPYANAGGLGEVGRSFPKALAETDRYEIRRVMPLYKSISHKLRYVTDFPVPMDHGYDTCVIKKEVDRKEVDTYFIQNSRFFYRDSIYGYEDDGFRFFFFCMAVVEMMKHMSYKPDIVQLNDWHTGFLPLLIKKEFPNIKTIYTIHNITYHGFIPASYLEGIVPEGELKKLGYPDWLNFMKAGILYADVLTTVSPGYAEEVKKPEVSGDLFYYLEERYNELVGITNGIDFVQYDPEKDGVLTYPYSAVNPEEKKRNRTELRSRYGLPDLEVPLIAMVTRLEQAKGIDLVIHAIKQMDLSSFQLIILGSGNSYYQEILADISAKYPKQVAVDFNYREDTAIRIYGAADIYLMPSQAEPCGLGQLYAMRYGAVPIVNPVGGLRDTVTDERDNLAKATGFYMPEWSGEALYLTMTRAIEAYHRPEWNSYINNCMNYNSSWSKRVVEYIKLYDSMLQIR
jgi:starch synthase